jgi:hypothetical protein
MKFYLVSLPWKARNCGHKLGIASMRAEPQTESKLSFSSVPKHLLMAPHGEGSFISVLAVWVL